ncbi:hypothetical protein B0H16DRAFT_1369285 [Mycena metata]|uniref:Glutaredoxin domain-containing protein n=1 Tax=Mycena metata TaxID=1033252 RepID=A0AAD7JEF4_9AGAR|nr:hypothetical protein B0H16DRAFT_1369285 [Mycena metata]
MAIPTMSSRTPLRGNHRSAQSLSLPFAVISGLNPKRNRSRTTLLAILALISVSAFFYCRQYPMSISPTYLLHDKVDTPATDQMVLALETNRDSRAAAARKHRKLSAGRSQITLTPAQELAAVSSFLASLPQNVIPSAVDPSRPINPELVLDFDTRSPHAMEEVARVVEDVWARNPVLLYGKLYSPATRELKAILSDMNLRPPPFIMDVDIRDDVEVLAPMLARLTQSPELPVLLIGGQPVGSLAQIRTMLASGELQRRVKAAGAVIGGGKRRKNKK